MVRANNSKVDVLGQYHISDCKYYVLMVLADYGKYEVTGVMRGLCVLCY